MKPQQTIQLEAQALFFLGRPLSLLGLRLLLLPLDEGLRLPLLFFICLEDSSDPDLLDADLIFPSFTCALRLLFMFLLRLPLLLLRLPLLKLLLPLELLLSLEYDRDRRLYLLLLPDFFSTVGEGEGDFLICFPSLNPRFLWCESHRFHPKKDQVSLGRRSFPVGVDSHREVVDR